MAFSRTPDIQDYVVVDERTAAFMALGMSQRSGEPVALVCTSGTALLNYAPAVAEAYYQHIPLIVISADRPMEWIDQDDSQTLRQYGALSHFVKRSYNLRAELSLPMDGWYFNRCINDALFILISLFPSRSRKKWICLPYGSVLLLAYLRRAFPMSIL